METARKIDEPHYTLDLTSRKIILNLEDVRLTRWIKASSISLSVPYLKYPFDYSSGLDTFRNQLMRIESLSVKAELSGLADAINGFQAETRILSIKSRGGGAVIACDMSGITFTARLDLLVSEWNEVILNIRDIRSYSTGDASAIEAIKKMIDAFHGSFVSEKGATFIKLKPLKEIVTNLFPIHGFKIPVYDGLRIVSATFNRDGLNLIFLPESAVFEGGGTDSWRLKAAGEDFAVKSSHPEIDLALAGRNARDALLSLIKLMEFHGVNSYFAERFLQAAALNEAYFKEGLDFAAEILKQNPDNIQALLASALIEGKRQRTDEALLFAGRLERIFEISLDEDDSRLLKRFTAELLAESDPLKASEIIDSLKEDSLLDGDIARLACMTNLRCGRLERALFFLRKVMLSQKGDQVISFLDSVTNEMKGRRDLLAALFDEVREVASAAGDAFLLAYIYRKLGELYISSQRGLARVYFLKSLECLFDEEVAAAVELLSEGRIEFSEYIYVLKRFYESSFSQTETGKVRPQVALRIGTVLRARLNAHGEGLKYLIEAFRNGARSQDVYEMIIDSARKTGSFERVLALLEEAVTSGGNFTERVSMLNKLHELLKETGLDNERLAQIEDELVSLGLMIPEHTVPEKKIEPAPAELFESIESEGNELARFANQAKEYLDAGKMDEAIASAEEGLYIDPDHVELLEIKCSAALRLGSYSKASEALKALASLIWDHQIRIQRLFLLSEILMDKMNDYRGGFEALREILMLDSNSAEALEKAESAASKGGLHKEFVELIDLIIEKIGAPPASKEEGKLLAALLIRKGRFFENVVKDLKSALNCYVQAVYHAKERGALVSMKRIYLALNMKKAAEETGKLISEIT